MIRFYPKAGHVLICNYNTGFQLPEMVKIRRVIIISPKSYNKQLCIVVPLSTTPPQETKNYHVRLASDKYAFLNNKQVWAKCDMVSHVSLNRLDRLKVFGVYQTPAILDEDLQMIRKGVCKAIGL